MGRNIAAFFGLVLVVFIVYLNVALYYQPSIATISGVRQNEDLLQSLEFLKEAIGNGAAEDMQELYPEGYVFLHALYGLAVADVIGGMSTSSPLYDKGLLEVRSACNAIGSEKGREVFDEFLPLPYGAFYNGWYNYLVGRRLLLERPADRSAAEVKAFRVRCATIAGAISVSETPYPVSYRSGAWPADVVLCVASLRLHDQLFPPRYDAVIRSWLARVRQQLDGNGLIPHAVHPATGAVQENARGSSQSLMLSFLPDIDSAFAHGQFKIYQHLFVASRFGLPCIREYPAGTWGPGDIDSGPVILQVGAAASLAGVRTMAVYNERKTFAGLRNSIEAFGIPTTHGGKKKYLFGCLPMADAFIAWGHAGFRDAAETTDAWQFSFHAYSSLLVGLIAALFLYVRRK